MVPQGVWINREWNPSQCDWEPGERIWVEHGEWRTASVTQYVCNNCFGIQLWSPQRLNLTVQIHNEVCVSVYAFNDLHTGYYFIVASSREREKQDSAIEAVYI